MTLFVSLYSLDAILYLLYWLEMSRVLRFHTVHPSPNNLSRCVRPTLVFPVDQYFSIYTLSNLPKFVQSISHEGGR